MPDKIYQYLTLKLSKNQIIIFVLSLTIIIFIITLINITLSRKNRKSTWENASSVTPQNLLKEVLSQKSTHNLNISSIKVMRLASVSTDDLYVFDFRSPQLCGIGGCLYSIYNLNGKLLLEFIADSHLLPKEKLIQVSDTVSQGFPCLIISQNTNINNLLLRTQFCYQQGKYVRFNENFTVGGKVE